ncbi:hypothetical protein P43SY_001446 [Pythium insidiosum]|uniref:DEP domain-containing protein n=1 Tax=Pythium insidiosum TaxID=114742 RepID=A0AAD5QBJ3_PYTIN|nr:hypothetical protein P43SY_001446 [Pythium insidiosum]
MVSFNHSVPEEMNTRREHMAEQAEILLKLAAKMKQGITTGDRRKNIFKKYPDCFTGMEAVDWMLEQMEAKSVAEAVRKGQGLLSARFIEKVDKEVKFEYSRKRFYRFTPTTPEIVHAPEHPMPNPGLDVPLSAPARRRALAALIGAFVADAASTSLNGVSHPEKTIPNLLRADFDPAFCGASDSGAFGFFARNTNSMESSTGFEARVILQAVASRGHINGAQLAKDAYWGFKTNKRMLSSTSRSFIKRIQGGKNWPHCAVKCRSIDVLSMIPVIVALYAGTESLFTKVDEVVKVFYAGHRVRDAALVAAFVLEQIILGASVLQAMRMSIRTERLTVKQRKVIFKAFTKSELPSYEAIQKFGNKGSLPGGFCAVLQPLFVLNDYATAVRENIIGGGRTCRRAMFIGACFGAQDGLEAIPEEWVRKTPYFDFIETDSAMLVNRRDLSGTFYEEQAEPEKARPSLARTESTPYVDYTPNTVLTASLLRASQRMYSGVRPRTNSIQSGASTPRSVASNFSYGSATTNGSSVGSVADFGDMSRFYSSKVTTPRSAQMGQDMMRFYQQNYAPSPRMSASGKPYTRSSSSTARSSDSAPNYSMSRGSRIGTRSSDTNVFFQSGTSAFSRSFSASLSGVSDSGRQNAMSGSNGGYSRSYSSSISGLSDRGRQPSHRHYSAHTEEPMEPMEPMDVDPVEVGTPDIVLAPRLSLTGKEHVSLHAIL